VPRLVYVPSGATDITAIAVRFEHERPTPGAVADAFTRKQKTITRYCENIAKLTYMMGRSGGARARPQYYRQGRPHFGHLRPSFLTLPAMRWGSSGRVHSRIIHSVDAVFVTGFASTLAAIFGRQKLTR